MANKRYDQFTTGNPTSTRITLHADPSSGALEKCNISDITNQSLYVAPQMALTTALGAPLINTGLSANWLDYGSTSFFVDQRNLFVLVWLPACTVTGVCYHSAVAGNYTASNFNGAALFSFNGTSTITQVAITNNDATPFKSASAVHYFPFTATLAISAGLYFISFLYCNSAQVQAPVYKTTNNHVTEMGDIAGNGFQCIFYKSTVTAIPSTQSITSGIVASSPYLNCGVY